MNNKTSYIVTIDLGATNMRFALFSSRNTISGRVKYPVRNYSDGTRHTKNLQKNLRTFLAAHRTKHITAIGVSVAGPLIPTRGAFRPATLRSDYVEITKPLTQTSGLATFLLSDTTAAAYGIHHHEHRHKKNITYITISTGIGVGALVDGHLLHGRDGSAGELGHAIVYSPYTQGAHSWEHYIAGHRDNNKGIIRFYQKWAVAHNIDINKAYTKPKDLFRAHNHRTNDIKGFMDAVGKINAQGVANVMFAYNPELIVFGGSIAYHNYDVIIQGVRKHIRRDLIKPLPQFKRTSLGDDVALIGAGYWARHQCALSNTPHK